MKQNQLYTGRNFAIRSAAKVFSSLTVYTRLLKMASNKKNPGRRGSQGSKRDKGLVRKPKHTAGGNRKRMAREKKEKEMELLKAQNSFDALPNDEQEDHQSDSDIIYDYDAAQKKKNDENNPIVLNDEDSGSEAENGGESDGNESDDVLIESDNEEHKADNGDDEVIEVDSDSDEDSRPSKKRKLQDNEWSNNNDFIGFGFVSSEDENADNYDEYSDDGVISNDEGGLVNPIEPTSLYPWIKAHDHSEQKEIADWLTMEMKDFVNYISPSKDEIMARNIVVKALKQQISTCWPGTETHVFGSCATDLYLPGSDIDMVVISPRGDCENRHKLYQLSSFLRQRKLAKDIEVIAGAKVPIIKFTDPKTNLNIDISFERTNGLEAARRIRKWLASTSGLRELVLVVKQFLRSRKLNNVHVGGLGGYATIILCYHFLKLHPRVSTNNMSVLDNLGSLLIEFFELYGRNFSYDNLVLAIDPETELPKYLKKSHHLDLVAGKSPFTIVVQDPSDPHNNITRSSYNLRDIKKAFGGAYQLLIDKCYRLNAASYKKRIGQLILGDIIKFRGKERDFNDARHLIENHALIVDEEGKNEDPDVSKEDDDVIIDPKYYSDATVDSDEEDSTFAEVPAVRVKSSNNNKKVSDFISIDTDNNESDTDKNDIKEDEEDSSSSKSNLDKEKKRDYWRQKGLEL